MVEGQSTMSSRERRVPVAAVRHGMRMRHTTVRGTVTVPAALAATVIILMGQGSLKQ